MCLFYLDYCKANPYYFFCFRFSPSIQRDDLLIIIGECLEFDARGESVLNHALADNNARKFLGRRLDESEWLNLLQMFIDQRFGITNLLAAATAGEAEAEGEDRARAAAPRSAAQHEAEEGATSSSSSFLLLLLEPRGFGDHSRSAKRQRAAGDSSAWGR